MQFDDFYETIGDFGPYQKVKYLLICFTNMLPPVMVYAWTFIAATPNFRCKLPFDDLISTNHSKELIAAYIPSDAQCRQSQKSISLRECRRCFQIVNISKTDDTFGELSACRNFVFDRTYYQSTVVEDVSPVARSSDALYTQQIAEIPSDSEKAWCDRERKPGMETHSDDSALKTPKTCIDLDVHTSSGQWCVIECHKRVMYKSSSFLAIWLVHFSLEFSPTGKHEEALLL